MWRLMYQDYENGPKYEFSAHRSKDAVERAKRNALKDPFWRAYTFSIEVDLDQPLLDQFVKEAKAALAEGSELILQTCGKASAWAAGFLQRPANMDFPEFSAYQDAVGDELVACGVLKVDDRRHQGMATHSPDRMRVSQSWWRKAHANSS